MKREIKKLDVGSVALVYGALLAAFGLLFALLFLGFGSAMMGIMGRSEGNAMFGGGIIMLIILPIVYGVLGIVIGAIFAVVYNLIAPLVGGIKVYISDAV
jgi:hypothetical protein